MNEIPKPPKGLSRAAQRWWKAINRDYELDATGQLILGRALESFDRVMLAKAAIEKDGLVLTDGAISRLHPAARAENDARLSMLRYIKALNLDIEVPGPIGRPPGRR
jgi:phage terminase small subunit